MADEKLQAHFKFDDADLEANRQGNFSKKQRVRLANIDIRERQFGKILGISLIVLAGLLVLTAIFWLHDAAFLFIWLPLGLLGGGIGVIILRVIPSKSKKFKLRKMEGVIKYSRSTHLSAGKSAIGSWIIHVGKSYFTVGENVPKIVTEGAEYIFYTYAFQGATYVLSVEPVTASDSPVETAVQPAQ